MSPEEFKEKAECHKYVAIERVRNRLMHWPVLRHRYRPDQMIAEEAALGGVENALIFADKHHRRFEGVLHPRPFVLWLRENGYTEALRLLLEHPFIWPSIQALGIDKSRLLYWLYVDQFNERQVALLLGVPSAEARRRGWQAYSELCSRLTGEGWGSEDLVFPLYPAEFGRSGLSL